MVSDVIHEIDTYKSHLEPFHLYIKHFFREGEKIKYHFILVHDTENSSDQFSGLIDGLLTRMKNIAITIYDHVGHGRSGGAKSYINSFKDYQEDLYHVVRNTSEKFNHDKVKKVIVSHGVGSMVVLKTFLKETIASELNIHSFIFSSPCIKPIIHIPTFLQPRVQLLKKSLGFMRISSRIKGRDLTRDKKLARSYDNNLHINKFMTLNLKLELLEASEKLIPLAYFWDKASLFLISESDSLVNVEATKLFCSGVDKTKCQFQYFKEAKHDLFNDTCRTEIFKGIIEFVNKG